MCIAAGVGAVIGAAVGGGIETYKQVKAGNGFNVGKIASRAGKGALVGGLVGLTGGAAASVVGLTGSTGIGAAATIAIPSAGVAATGSAIVSVTNDISDGKSASEVSANSVKAFATNGVGAAVGGAASPAVSKIITNSSKFGGVGALTSGGSVAAEGTTNAISSVASTLATTASSATSDGEINIHKPMKEE